MVEFADLEPVVAAHEQRWVVHNLHTPAIEIDAGGTYSHDGIARIAAGAPLHTAETREEAEAWRERRKAALMGGR